MKHIQFPMNIKRIEEFLIEESEQEAIRSLLANCFPEYPSGKSFYKQLPDFRFLIWDQEQLIAHMAIENRLMNNSGTLIHVFGIADLCVLDHYQHQKLASSMLEELENLGKSRNIDFIVLLAKKHELYLKNGFQLKNNVCKWVLINANQTLGVAKRKLEYSLLIKPISNKGWKEGTLDFMGHIF